MTCENCRAAERVLYGPAKKPQLKLNQIGNYICLERCESCDAYWCTSPYEPYLSFEYAVLWPWTPEQWADLHARDDGRYLLQWHATCIRRHWRDLPPDEREGVMRHRRRTGMNPIDGPRVLGSTPLDLTPLLSPNDD